MINKDKAEDPKFEAMSVASQFTNYTASLYADDEGFIKVSELIYRSHCSRKEINENIENKFFEENNGILKINNWEIEQELKKDRVKKSVLKGYFDDVDNSETERRQTGDNLSPQNRLEENRIDKNSNTSVGEDSIQFKFDDFINYFNSKFKTKFKPTDSLKKKFQNRRSSFSKEELKDCIDKALADDFYSGRAKGKWYVTPEWILKNDENPQKLLNLSRGRPEEDEKEKVKRAMQRDTEKTQELLRKQQERIEKRKEWLERISKN